MAAGIPVLRQEIRQAVDQATQQARGSDIDHLIEEIAATKFDELSKEYENDVQDKLKFKKIKKTLMVASVVLAVIAVVAAVASIFFSAGTVTAGALAIAAASGMVSITTSFKQLDSTIEKFITYYRTDHLEKTRINKLKKKISNVSTLLHKRISDLTHLGEEQRGTRAREVLGQIRKVNEFIEKIKEEVPQKIMKFDVIDPSPLLRAVGDA